MSTQLYAEVRSNTISAGDGGTTQSLKAPSIAPPSIAPSSIAPRAAISPEPTSSIFDDAFDILKNNFIPILLLVGLFLLPVQLLQEYIVARWLHRFATYVSLQGDSADLSQLLESWFAYIIVGDPRNAIPGAITLILPVFVSAPVTICVMQTVRGSRMDIVRAIRESGASMASVGLAAMLAIFACVIVYTVTLLFLAGGGAFVIGVATMVMQSAMQSLPGQILVVIYFVVVIVVPYVVTCLFFGRAFAFIVPSIVVEKLGPFDGIWRSQQLASTVKYSTTTMIYCSLPPLILILQLAMINGCRSALELFGLAPPYQFLCNTILRVVLSCSLQAYWMILIARLYYDYRIRRECLDIRQMLAVKE